MAIARFIRCLEAGDPSPSTATAARGATTRTSTTSLDGVEAALDRSLSFEIVNLGGAHPVTLTDLVASLERATGRTATLDRRPDQPGDVPVTFAAVEKAERVLGFHAKVALDEGLRRTVAWQRSHSPRTAAART